METFDWPLAIRRNRDELLRIVAALFALVGPEKGGDVPTLRRHLRDYVLRVLRPAESAVRRLIIIAARGVKVTLRPSSGREETPSSSVILGLDPRTHSVKPGLAAKDRSTSLVLRHGGFREFSGVGPRVKPEDDGLGRTSRPIVDKISAFPLLDPLKRFDFSTRRYATTVPRIAALCRDWSVPVYLRLPDPPAKPEPSPDDPVDATRLCRRLLTLKRALDDLPGQARRMARWNARRKLAGTCPGRRTEPMRPGWPPGHRQRHRHDIDEVLRECHSLAVYARKLDSS